MDLILGYISDVLLVFQYENAKATLKSTLLEETPTQAIFSFDKAIVKINTQFHAPSSVTILENEKEETIGFNYKTNGYNFEIEHFNTLLRENKKESDIMTYTFSENLIKIIDEVRQVIGLEYKF